MSQSSSLNLVCVAPTGNDRNTQCREPVGMDIDHACIRALQLRSHEMALVGVAKCACMESALSLFPESRGR